MGLGLVRSLRDRETSDGPSKPCKENFIWDSIHGCSMQIQKLLDKKVKSINIQLIKNIYKIYL